MKLFDQFKAVLPGSKPKGWENVVAEVQAREIQAANLQPPPLPKAPKGQVAQPGYRTRIEPSTSALQKPSTRSSSLDRVAELRQQNTDYAALRAIQKYSPEIGSAVSLMLRMAITKKFKVVGRDLDGQVSPEATLMAQELLRRLTFMGNPDGSFTAQKGIHTLCETLAIDGLLSGAMALEVALDKARIPAQFVPVAVSTLVIYDEDSSYKMVQKVGGTEIDLDIPTFIYTPWDQVVTEAYATSPLTASMQPVMTDLEFNNDTRRALKRAVLPRLAVTIDLEKVKKGTPPDILADSELFATYLNNVRSLVESVVNSAQPEEAFVGFDYVDYKYIDGGFDPSQVIERVQKVLNAKLVAGVRTLPVALGFTSTSNASSTESMLFIKTCEGLQMKLNETLSRGLTVAVRLMGIDAYVEFAFDSVNLRPEDELEAFKSMRQSRILEQLSLGFITDEEASLELTGHLPRPGAPKLSGTMFKVASGVSANPTSNTANGAERNMKPDTPEQPKS